MGDVELSILRLLQGLDSSVYRALVNLNLST